MCIEFKKNCNKCCVCSASSLPECSLWFFSTYTMSLRGLCSFLSMLKPFSTSSMSLLPASPLKPFPGSQPSGPGEKKVPASFPSSLLLPVWRGLSRGNKNAACKPPVCLNGTHYHLISSDGKHLVRLCGRQAASEAWEGGRQDGSH